MRKRMVKVLVLPKALWNAAWQEAPDKEMRKLRITIERCIRGREGHTSSRSRLLIWANSLGADACPYFYAGRALGAERRRRILGLNRGEVREINGKGNQTNQQRQ